MKIYSKVVRKQVNQSAVLFGKQRYMKSTIEREIKPKSRATAISVTKSIKKGIIINCSD